MVQSGFLTPSGYDSKGSTEVLLLQEFSLEISETQLPCPIREFFFSPVGFSSLLKHIGLHVWCLMSVDMWVVIKRTSQTGNEVNTSCVYFSLTFVLLSCLSRGTFGRGHIKGSS